ncbi:MAG: hypothetical protein Q7J34_10355 [Bacteroidales bacterium]|jgi:hypothetical protein|nr:hypothetical protein [Bacteroidales bacterium]
MKYPLIVIFLIFLLLSGCSPLQHGNRHIQYRINAGANSGGITENTDLGLIPGLGIDAVSGATKIGLHSGAQLVIPLNSNAIQSGIEFMANHQVITFNDNTNGFIGQRNITLNQWMLPLSYIMVVGGNKRDGGYLQFKIGALLQYNRVHIYDHAANLPEFETKPISGGINLGVISFPFRFQNGSALGLYIEGYRGSRIYTDYYNPQNIQTPGSSYLKAGIIFSFCIKSN